MLPEEALGLRQVESKDRCSCTELNTVDLRGAIIVKQIEENLFDLLLREGFHSDFVAQRYCPPAELRIRRLPPEDSSVHA